MLFLCSRIWWLRLGRKRYPSCSRLLITADSGGSNASRNRLWKLQLQHPADETGLIIEVCHYPPGTSKWNKLEHRLFCHITRNWRGVPLETREIVVSSIRNTRTESGLEVHAWLDEKIYEKELMLTISNCLSASSKGTNSMVTGTTKSTREQTSDSGNLLLRSSLAKSARNFSLEFGSLRYCGQNRLQFDEWSTPKSPQ